MGIVWIIFVICICIIAIDYLIDRLEVKCPKCGNNKFHIKTEGNSEFLICDKCGHKF